MFFYVKGSFSRRKKDSISYLIEQNFRFIVNDIHVHQETSSSTSRNDYWKYERFIKHYCEMKLFHYHETPIYVFSTPFFSAARYYKDFIARFSSLDDFWNSLWYINDALSSSHNVVIYITWASPKYVFCRLFYIGTVHHNNINSSRNISLIFLHAKIKPLITTFLVFVIFSFFWTLRTFHYNLGT